jgi:hypothetical protein
MVQYVATRTSQTTTGAATEVIQLNEVLPNRPPKYRNNRK